MKVSHPRLVPEPPKSEEPPKTSSLPSEGPREQVELFHDVLQVLENNRVPYAVSGAFALQQHTGICRFTKDLDLFVTAQASAAAMKCLELAGMECEVTDPVWLSKARRDGFFVDLITGMSNGVITVEDSWIERAYPAVVYGVLTRVLAPEELVASKIFVARRERFDGVDIAHIIYGTQGRFDWDRELQLVGEHWEMLFWNLVLFRYSYPAHSHLVPDKIWLELLSRFEHEIRNRDPHADFRGSLVDDNMFAIDVNEWRMANLVGEQRRLRLSKLPAGENSNECKGSILARKK